MNENEDERNIRLMTKLKNFQIAIMNFLNQKLEINIKGNEIKLDLNNKNIGNIELELLSSIRFDNLNELNLSNNKISDIEYINKFQAKNLKKIYLSNNLLKNNVNLDFKLLNNLEVVNLDNNDISDINDILKNKLKKQKKRNLNLDYNEIYKIKTKKKLEISLNGNKYIQKELNEIKKEINTIYNSESTQIQNDEVIDGIGPNSQISDFKKIIKSEAYKKDFNNKLLNKINNVEKKVLNYMNIKLNVHITGKEIILKLNNKKIGDSEIKLLSNVEFNNLEELDISHNLISNIDPLVKLKKLRILNLSYNKISNINCIKDIIKNNNKLKIINLGNNNIDKDGANVLIEERSISKLIGEINLDSNKLIKKEIDEILKTIADNRNNKNDLQKRDFRNDFDVIEEIDENIYKVKSKGTGGLKIAIVYTTSSLNEYIRENYLRDYNEEDYKKYINNIIDLINNMGIIEGENKENKNAIKLEEYFQTKEEFTIIIELYEKNLLNYITEKERTFNSDEIYGMLEQLNNTFKVMNDYKIVDGNINLGSIFINENQLIYKLKLTYVINNSEIAYIAPEILKNENNKEKSDLWSLGVIIYILYFKELPYKGLLKFELLEDIKRNGQKNLKRVNETDLDDLIHKLLVEDPNQRLSWNDYFNHSFFKNREMAII